jgi:predicted ABC-type ATPase
VAKECEVFVEEHITNRRSFAVETTLRTSAAIDQGRSARRAGFATELIFVATESIDENIARILQRAQGGGHGASESDVRAIHQASMANLASTLDAFEYVDIYDSTERWVAPRLVASANAGVVSRHGQIPAWLERALSAPRS